MDLFVGADGEVSAHRGGGPFNAARTIARLGQPVAFLGPLSVDAFGVSLRSALDEDGVMFDTGLLTELPTTLALVDLDASGSARYRFYAQGTSAPSLSAAQAADALPDGLHSLHVGALGLVFEPSATTLRDLVAGLRGRALLSLDPNVRPHAISDADAHRGLIHDLASRVDLVKLSDDDAIFLAPGADPRETASALLGLGPALVILTRGARGALALGHGWSTEVAAPRIEVVDTVGAGDAFSGAFLAHLRRRGRGREALAERDAVREATAFAVTAAAETCRRPGADPPRLADLPADAGLRASR